MLHSHFVLNGMFLFSAYYWIGRGFFFPVKSLVTILYTQTV